MRIRQQQNLRSRGVPLLRLVLRRPRRISTGFWDEHGPVVLPNVKSRCSGWLPKGEATQTLRECWY